MVVAVVVVVAVVAMMVAALATAVLVVAAVTGPSNGRPEIMVEAEAALPHSTRP